MSSVERAVKKVKGLNEREAKALLVWLDTRKESVRSARPVTKSRVKKKYPNTRQLMAWYKSIRGTTDWEPPKMPADRVQRIKL